MNIFGYLSKKDYKIRKYNDGDVIYKNNTICSVISYVENGEVIATTLMPNNEEKTIRNIKEGGYIGINLAFSSNSIYRATFTSVGETTIYEVDKNKLIKLMANNQDLLKSFLTELSDTAIKQFDYLALINKKTIRARFCYYLYKEAKRSNQTELDLPNKTILSSILQIERPSLGLEIKKLCDEGIIQNKNKHYKILDMDKLTNAF